jgi:hypothetical protein
MTADEDLALRGAEPDRDRHWGASHALVQYRLEP